MKLTIGLLALTLSGSVLACDIDVKESAEEFNKEPMINLATKHCENNARYRGDIDSCLDDQFNYFLETVRLCPTGDEVTKVLKAGMKYNRQAVPVEIDFKAVYMQALTESAMRVMK